MKLTPNSFFDGDFKLINLNNFLSSHGIHDTKKPELVQDTVNKLGYNTYGGYGENRKDIFKNSYLEEIRKFYHLGIDINVRAGTPIKCPFDCRVVDIFIDPDEDIGWGGRMIISQISDYYGKPCYTLPLLILAHLNPKTITKKKLLTKGEIIGKVGTWPTNGNVFEHLHIQCINDPFEDFDGYGTKRDLKNNPDPFQVEF